MGSIIAWFGNMIDGLSRWWCVHLSVLSELSSMSCSLSTVSWTKARKKVKDLSHLNNGYCSRSGKRLRGASSYRPFGSSTINTHRSAKLGLCIAYIISIYITLFTCKVRFSPAESHHLWCCFSTPGIINRVNQNHSFCLCVVVVFFHSSSGTLANLIRVIRDMEQWSVHN